MIGTSTSRIPIICADRSTWESATIFNPNSWSGDSKGIIQSCWVEFSVLRFCAVQIQAICADREKLCQPQIAEILKQYQTAKFPIEKSIVLVEKPDLHLRIEAFFSGIKSLLDLIVGLLATEKIVNTAVHGFHRSNNVYGGTVINALQNNAVKSHKILANKIDKLLAKHKNDWIDQLISARDDLVHPKKGMFQLMFQLDFVEFDGSLRCTQIKAPTIGFTPIDQYAVRTLEQTTELVSAFLALLRRTETGGNTASTLQ